MKSRLSFRTFSLYLLLIPIVSISFNVNLSAQTTAMSYEEYIRGSTASEEEIDVFLNELSWAQFDQEVGYILGNYYPTDGWNNSRTISTAREDGARSSFNYTDRPCRINSYGNSFTQCHQANDAETWQEYLAGHLGEPVRNYGMGGFGVYQAYRRMLREEQSENSAEYLLFYIWGDDHLRSLLRCRYALTQGWNKKTDETEGIGKMFHGNFWPNVEMNLSTGKLEEHESRIRDREKLVQMTDPDWMYENLKDDLALQLYLFKLGKISQMDMKKMNRLAECLDVEFNEQAEDMREEAGALLNHYGFASTIYLLQKSREFADAHGKKLMVILFDPG
ncbi:MAG: hypothetical protein GY790_21585, partial [Bacteroidetes bacterium]|nr:hypothetical protein [Bacteroidota bacterium]